MTGLLSWVTILSLGVAIASAFPYRMQPAGFQIGPNRAFPQLAQMAGPPMMMGMPLPMSQGGRFQAPTGGMFASSNIGHMYPPQTMGGRQPIHPQRTIGSRQLARQSQRTQLSQQAQSYNNLRRMEAQLDAQENRLSAAEDRLETQMEYVPNRVRNVAELHRGG